MRATMAECPDCYSVEICAVPPRGDGKCSTCRGTGEEQGLGGWGADFLGVEKADCPICDGSGDCQTCDGTGEVEDEVEEEEEDEDDEEGEDDENEDEEENEDD